MTPSSTKQPEPSAERAPEEVARGSAERDVESAAPVVERDGGASRYRPDEPAWVNSTVGRSVRRGGRALRHSLSVTLDRILNVDTAEGVHLAQLGLDAPDRVGYEAGGWRDIPRVLPPSEVTPGDVFLDLGSGKGRLVLAAARYRFDRVIGVELADYLTAIARRNVAACRLRRRAGGIELVTADVLAYRIPDDVTVVYMFNPFTGKVFDSVVAQLVASVDRRPRDLRLILRNGTSRDRLMHTGRFALRRTSLGLRPGRKWREATAVRLYVLEPRAHPD